METTCRSVAKPCLQFFVEHAGRVEDGSGCLSIFTAPAVRNLNRNLTMDDPKELPGRTPSICKTGQRHLHQHLILARSSTCQM